MSVPIGSRTGGIPSRVRSIEAAAIAGIVYAVLKLVALTLFNGFPPLSPSGELSRWFDDAGHRASLILALNLAAISSIAFLWFVAVIRRRIGDRADPFFTTVFLGASSAYVAAWFLAASAIAAPAVAVTLHDAATISPSGAALASGLGSALLLVVAPRLQAVFVFTATTILLRARTLPTWLTMLGYVFGSVLFIVPLVTRPLGVAFPVWVLVVSIGLLVTHPTTPPPDPPEADVAVTHGGRRP